MRALVLRKYGPPGGLRIEEQPRPQPAPGEALIRVRAASVNDWDWAMIRGAPVYMRLLCGLFRPRIRIPGVDVAGEIETVNGETDLQPGVRVYADLSECGFGAFAEYVCAPHSALTPMPEGMNFVDAAALPHAALLAWQGLFDEAALKPAHKLLINGAGGGVGAIGVQLARAIGASDITGVDRGDKFSAMRSAGYRRVIDYTREDFTKLGDRYDVILDPKTNRPVSHYLRVLNEGGVYVTVGGDALRLLSVAMRQRRARNENEKRVRVLGLKANKGLDEISRLYSEGAVRPVVDGPYRFDELPRLIQRFGEGKHVGKIVVEIG